MPETKFVNEDDPVGLSVQFANAPSWRLRVRCIGVASSEGGASPGCEQTPALLWENGLRDILHEHASVSCEWLGAQAGRGKLPLGRLLARLADGVAEAIAAGCFPLIIGGDHSIAAGTWRGVGRAIAQPPGLLWIDAHLDAHTPDTSPSGNLHGMPLAALLGDGAPVLTNIPGPGLDPSRIVLLGARSYEPAEWTYLQQQGVRVITAKEIEERGLESVMAEARTIVSRDGPWGVSLDVDAIDPEHAPAVSTPVPGGLKPDALAQALYGLFLDPGCCAFELAEFNVALAGAKKTKGMLLNLIRAMSAGALHE